MAYVPVQPRDPTAVMGRRIVAFLLDGLIAAGVAIAILAATKKQLYTGAPSNACDRLPDPNFSGQCVQIGSYVWTWSGGGLSIGEGVAGLVGLLNLVLLQGVTGASIGKMAMGLRVVNAQGKPCGVGRAFLRWILFAVDAVPFCFPLVGLITASVTHPHRRVGDMAAGTYVVGTADAGAPVVAQAPAYSSYGTPPPPGAWGPPGVAPPPSPGWGAPAPSAPTPDWGAPPPPAPDWGAPAPPPPPERFAGPTPTSPAPPPPSPAPPSWGSPAPPPSPAPAAPAPSPAPAPPAPPAEAAPAPPPPAPPRAGESWWDKAVDDDEEPKQ